MASTSTYNIKLLIWKDNIIEEINLMDQMIDKIITNSHKTAKKIWKLNLKSIKRLKACFICLHNLDIAGCEEFIKKYKETELKVWEIYDESRIQKTFTYTAELQAWSAHEKEGGYIADADVCKSNLKNLEKLLKSARRLKNMLN